MARLRIASPSLGFALIFLLLANIALLFNTIAEANEHGLGHFNKRALPIQISPNPTASAPDPSTQPTDAPTPTPTSNSPATDTKNDPTNKPQPTNTGGGNTGNGNNGNTGNGNAGNDNGNNGGPKPATIVKTSTNANNAVVTVTSTSYSEQGYTGTALQSSTAAANNQKASSSEGGTGSAVTAAIVVAAVVVSTAIGIWIFRKWKLSPSRNFKEKIQPVSFSPRDHNSDALFLRELNEP